MVSGDRPSNCFRSISRQVVFDEVDLRDWNTFEYFGNRFRTFSRELVVVDIQCLQIWLVS